ncbi:MAG: hypothetical protein LUD76_09270 [Alistipes sp.]|nr:hypothetical protein [Alistipes sp.]
MKISELTAPVFGRRFLVNSAITFAVLLVLSCIGFLFHYADRFIMNRVSFGASFGCWLLAGAAMLTQMVSLSLCVATFLGFRRIPEQAGIAGFLKLLAAGTALAVVAAIFMFSYDRNVTPVLKARLSEKLYVLTAQSDRYPSRTGTREEQNHRFRNMEPFMTENRILRHRIDSLSGRLSTLRSECYYLLATLPDSLASSAYVSYRLGEAGVPYTFSGHDREAATGASDHTNTEGSLPGTADRLTAEGETVPGEKGPGLQSEGLETTRLNADTGGRETGTDVGETGTPQPGTAPDGKKGLYTESVTTDTPDLQSDDLHRETTAELYGKAVRLYDTANLLRRYRFESAKRTATAAGFLLCFIIYAAVGYALRHKTLRLIMSVIAVLVMAVYLLQLVTSGISANVDRQFRSAREYRPPQQ